MRWILILIHAYRNNASDTMVPIDDIGFIYNCVFKQKKAFEYSVEAIRRV